LKGVKLLVPLVRNETPYHFVLIDEISATKNLTRIVTDPSGNEYALWEIDDIPRGRSFTVNISYFILSFDVTFSIGTSITQQDDQTSENQKYTKPELHIESDNPYIVEAAKKAVGNETDPHKQVLMISKFVTDSLRYELQTEERGALWALQHGVGDCSEYSYLFVALCRALGIPSRIQAGFAFHELGETTEYGHMWAEYHLKNYGWVPVDLTWGLVDRLDNLHFTSMQSPPVFSPYDNYYIEYPQRPGVKLKDQQVIRVLGASVDVFKGFEAAYETYKAVSTIQNAENLARLAERLGARVLLSEEFQELKGALHNADLNLQRFMEDGNTGFQKSANEEAERADRLARDVLFKNSVILVGSVFVVVLAFMAVGSRRKPVEAY